MSYFLEIVRMVKILALPHVSKLRLRVCKGILHVKDLCSNKSLVLWRINLTEIIKLPQVELNLTTVIFWVVVYLK